MSFKLPVHAFLQKAEASIQDHFEDPDFDVNRLCSLLNISRAQLHRNLSAAGSPPAIELIHAHRLSKACHLLSNSCLNIGEIAYCCGFNHPHYFSRLFHKKFNSSPRQYRDQSQ